MRPAWLCSLAAKAAALRRAGFPADEWILVKKLLTFELDDANLKRRLVIDNLKNVLICKRERSAVIWKVWELYRAREGEW